MDFRNIGGAKMSPVIPVGCDFPNHNILKSSSMYYAEYFGFYDYYDSTTYRKYDLSFSEATGYHRYKSFKAKLVDPDYNCDRYEEIYSSVYLWVDYNVKKNNQLFVNYGKYHSSANRLALFGFIDDDQPYEYIDLYVDYNYTDRNVGYKIEMFSSFWDEKWLKKQGYYYDMYSGIKTLVCYDILFLKIEME